MIKLKAELRNPKIKANKLRRDGFVTGVLFGSDMKESTPLQFAAKEALSFIKNNKEGAQVILEIGDEKISAVAKTIDYDFMKKQLLVLDFQSLVAGEKISTTVQLKLLNEDFVQGSIEQDLSELHYKADPANLLDTIEIDFKKFSPDLRNLYVKDLKFDTEKDIELVTSEDALILHISEHMGDDETAADAAAEE